jgi:hypothetical protein
VRRLLVAVATMLLGHACAARATSRRRSWGLAFLLLVGGVVAACGGKANGPVDLRGSIGRSAAPSAEAVVVGSGLGPDPDPTFVPNYIVIASFGGVCDAFQRGEVPGYAALTLELHAEQAESLAPGLYPVQNTSTAQSSSYAKAAYVTQPPGSSMCSATSSVSASSGSVTISATSTAEVEGSVELAFPGGDRVSGPFVASRCYVDASTWAPGVATCP